MGKATVLVVEDNVLNLKLFRTLLEINGYDVLAAATAQEGIAAAGEHLPDLLLMDVQLPGMDGLEATRILKGNPATAGIPVIAITAYAMPGDAERCRSAGCSGYIAKPVDTRTFASEVRRHLGVDG